MSDLTAIFKDADALRAYFMERGWSIYMEDNGQAVIDPFAAIIESGRAVQDGLDPERLREQLAALEHDQWVEWSRTVAEQGLTPERLERWERFWVPYHHLDEATKDHDRVWADKVLAILRAAPPLHDPQEARSSILSSAQGRQPWQRRRRGSSASASSASPITSRLP